ncbi:hypothetical protein COV24_00780 [candidate division WWE3 bacterium CG10_big_fil_rev_8_21_14_0_10_32_10]|uniref:Major facilitator superfamily (MFS) profile domain-containing protein n=1 Tax=candidate division WWE3 bacterium CG10_big_fil_rev_8_21_14_0_10_32_10 TaxID=1975090 RepID=A0A2H0RB51_UNCKA|nr:MAG: hypothetical protein COV24_00780 [candidate division WWE3 bacterium CG10_big_fil_rev_8_21_14_0_10_32_10]
MPLSTYSKTDHTHSHLWGKISITESSAVYLTHTIKTLGLAMVGIFLPLFIYNLNFPIAFFASEFTNRVFWILVYFGIQSVVLVLIISFFAKYSFSKISLKYLLLISNIVQILEVIIWYNAENNPYLMILAGILAGIVITFYWIPYHLFFIEKNSDKEGHFGKNLGIGNFLAGSVNALGPLFGGFIIATLGFNALFLMVSIIILISSFPILFGVSEGKHYMGSLTYIYKQYILNPAYKYVSVGFFGISMDGIIFAIFWPLFLFFALNNFEQIGTLSFATILASSFMVILIGKVVDTKRGKTIHALGVCINSTFHLVRILLSVPLHVYILDLFDRLNGFYGLPFTAKTYEIAKKGNDLDFIVYREFIIHVARIFTIVLVMLFLAVSSNWKLVFILASFGSALSFLINYYKRKPVIISILDKTLS